MIQTTETLYGYTFTKKGEPQRIITAIFPMSEERARELFERRHGSSAGWTLQPNDQAVKCSTPADGEDTETMRTWRFVFSRTESIEVEVEAEDGEEARKLAKQEAKDASSFDWEVDPHMEEDEFEDLGPVDEEKAS